MSHDAIPVFIAVAGLVFAGMGALSGLNPRRWKNG